MGYRQARSKEAKLKCLLEKADYEDEVRLPRERRFSISVAAVDLACSLRDDRLAEFQQSGVTDQQVP